MAIILNTDKNWNCGSVSMLQTYRKYIKRLRTSLSIKNVDTTMLIVLFVFFCNDEGIQPYKANINNFIVFNFTTWVLNKCKCYGTIEIDRLYHILLKSYSSKGIF